VQLITIPKLIEQFALRLGGRFRKDIRPNDFFYLVVKDAEGNTFEGKFKMLDDKLATLIANHNPKNGHTETFVEEFTFYYNPEDMAFFTKESTYKW
jgi:hypothetical protein